MENLKVQKIQKETILKNMASSSKLIPAFKKYKKKQSLRTTAASKPSNSSSKNTKRNNP